MCWHAPLRYNHAHPSLPDDESRYVASRQETCHKPAGMYLFFPPHETSTGARNGVASRLWRSSSAWAANAIAAKRGRVSATVRRSSNIHVPPCAASFAEGSRLVVQHKNSM